MPESSKQANQIPAEAAAAILLPSQPVPDDSIAVSGPNFDYDLSLNSFLASFERIGFQASSFGQAVDIVNQMVITTFIK